MFTGHTTHTHTQAHHTERARFNALPHLVAMHPVNGRHQSPLQSVSPACAALLPSNAPCIEYVHAAGQPVHGCGGHAVHLQLMRFDAHAGSSPAVAAGCGQLAPDDERLRVDLP